jgi:hypothetical protein
VASGVLVTKVAEVEAVAIVDAVMGEDAGAAREVVVGRRKTMSVVVVASWATGLKRRRIRPTRSMKRRLR